MEDTFIFQLVYFIMVALVSTFFWFFPRVVQKKLYVEKEDLYNITIIIVLAEITNVVAFFITRGIFA